MKLVVRDPFGDYVKGQEITDEKVIVEVLASHGSRVIKVATPPPTK